MSESTRFTLIDQIIEFTPGESIRAVKYLDSGEEYLRDHFPRFPVMPGVLMLETLTQAGAWLVYLSEDYRRSTVLLKEARNVKYADFVQPGQKLIVQAEMVKQEGSLTTLKAKGFVEQTLAVSGRLILEAFNIEERYSDRAAWDAYARKRLRKEFEQIHRPVLAT